MFSYLLSPSAHGLSAPLFAILVRVCTYVAGTEMTNIDQTLFTSIYHKHHRPERFLLQELEFVFHLFEHMMLEFFKFEINDVQNLQLLT